MPVMRSLSGFLATFLLSIVPFATQAQDQACHSTVVGHLDILPIASRIFNNSRNLRVWLPPGYESASNARKRYPVLYLLDGQNVFDACTAYNHEEMRADETLTELIATGKIEPLIVVAVDNGSGKSDNGEQRGREYLPYPDPMNPSVKDVAGNDFPRFMETEVMPPVSAKYRVLSGPEHSAIGGASYGAVAALYALIRRPDLFDSGIIESPSIQAGNGQMLRDTISLVIGPTRIAIGAGTAEGFPTASEDAAYVRMVSTLAGNLRTEAFSRTEVQLTIREGAKHSNRYFGERFAAALMFLFPSQTAP